MIYGKFLVSAPATQAFVPVSFAQISPLRSSVFPAISFFLCAASLIVCINFVWIVAFPRASTFLCAFFPLLASVLVWSAVTLFFRVVIPPVSRVSAFLFYVVFLPFKDASTSAWRTIPGIIPFVAITLWTRLPIFFRQEKTSLLNSLTGGCVLSFLLDRSYRSQVPEMFQHLPGQLVSI